jgi:hypothetical protein
MPSKIVTHLNKMLMFLTMVITLTTKTFTQLGKLRTSNSKTILKSMRKKMLKKTNWKKKSSLSKLKLRKMLLILMIPMSCICKVKLLWIILAQLKSKSMPQQSKWLKSLYSHRKMHLSSTLAVICHSRVRKYSQNLQRRRLPNKSSS